MRHNSWRRHCGCLFVCNRACKRCGSRSPGSRTAGDVSRQRACAVLADGRWSNDGGREGLRRRRGSGRNFQGCSPGDHGGTSDAASGGHFRVSAQSRVGADSYEQPSNAWRSSHPPPSGDDSRRRRRPPAASGPAAATSPYTAAHGQPGAAPTNSGQGVAECARPWGCENVHATGGSEWRMLNAEGRRKRQRGCQRTSEQARTSRQQHATLAWLRMHRVAPGTCVMMA